MKTKNEQLKEMNLQLEYRKMQKAIDLLFTEVNNTKYQKDIWKIIDTFDKDSKDFFYSLQDKLNYF